MTPHPHPAPQPCFGMGSGSQVDSANNVRQVFVSNGSRANIFLEISQFTLGGFPPLPPGILKVLCYREALSPHVVLSRAAEGVNSLSLLPVVTEVPPTLESPAGSSRSLRCLGRVNWRLEFPDQRRTRLGPWTPESEGAGGWRPRG